MVFGSPAMTSSEEAILAEIQASIASSERHSEACVKSDEMAMCGELLYKRNERKNMFYAKVWKPRYFVIADAVLLCYHDQKALQAEEPPLRAIPLNEVLRIQHTQARIC